MDDLMLKTLLKKKKKNEIYRAFLKYSFNVAKKYVKKHYEIIIETIIYIIKWLSFHICLIFQKKKMLITYDKPERKITLQITDEFVRNILHIINNYDTTIPYFENDLMINWKESYGIVANIQNGTIASPKHINSIILTYKKHIFQINQCVSIDNGIITNHNTYLLQILNERYDELSKYYNDCVCYTINGKNCFYEIYETFKHLFIDCKVSMINILSISYYCAYYSTDQYKKRIVEIFSVYPITNVEKNMVIDFNQQMITSFKNYLNHDIEKIKYTIDANLSNNMSIVDELVINVNNKFQKEKRENKINVLSVNVNDDNDIIYSTNGSVQPTCVMENLFLKHDEKSLLINAMKSFKDKECGNLKILFDGSPGCGKTTSVKTIGIYLERDIYYLQLNSVKNDEQLVNIFKTIVVEKKGIIILEDVDAMTSIVKKTNKRNNNVTFECLIDLLNGKFENTIVLMTTNMKHELDEELINCMNYHVTLTKCNKYQINLIYNRIIGRFIPNEILNVIEDGKYTPAYVKNELIKYYRTRNQISDMDILKNLFN